MHTVPQIFSTETLPLTRYQLNADGIYEPEMVSGFISKAFPTNARARDGSLLFGLLRGEEEIEQSRLAAEAVFRWRQHADEPAVLDAVFKLSKPQSGLDLLPGGDVFSPIRADFETACSALQVESFRNRTVVTFGNLAVTGSGITLEPSAVSWHTSESGAKEAQNRLVRDHIDFILCGKIKSILEGKIQVEPEPIELVQ